MGVSGTVQEFCRISPSGGWRRPEGKIGNAVHIRFGPFTLDFDRRQLMRDGDDVHLTPKAFDLLVLLVRERPKALAKTVLQQELWPDTFVAEANLSNLVAEVRKGLGDRPRAPTWIRTAHGFGYAFAGETIGGARTDAAAVRPTCWLEWGRRRFRLVPGEHVIGRDAGVDVRLDASTVSRRHARIVVSDAEVWLEDCDSKNGTSRGGIRLTAPVSLADGEIIGIGSLRLTFHVMAPVVSTDTQVTSAP